MPGHRPTWTTACGTDVRCLISNDRGRLPVLRSGSRQDLLRIRTRHRFMGFMGSMGWLPGLSPQISLEMAKAESVDIVVSFVLKSGVDRVFPHLFDLLERGGRLRFLTGDYLGITEPDALLRLLDLEGNIDCRIFETAINQQV